MNDKENLKEIKKLTLKIQKEMLTTKEIISEADSKKTMDKLYEQENLINKRLSIIEVELVSVPDPDKVKRLAKWSVGITQDVTKNPKYIMMQSYEHQRKVVESAFAGKDAHGRRLGVYMEETEDSKIKWKFEIRGLVENTVLSLPLSDDYLEDAFKLDPYYQDTKKELENITTSFPSYSPPIYYSTVYQSPNLPVYKSTIIPIL
jgi:hypothetical protein